ncbi:right-handed parallel beta-helix repeat-containing protein [Neisseria sp.]|uniref:right-handed parallel beta-helix repeat-containing protein n=1 Tax=Neisseria sp. TaxID=192066 RepID=UPI00359FC86D
MQKTNGTVAATSAVLPLQKAETAEIRPVGTDAAKKSDADIFENARYLEKMFRSGTGAVVEKSVSAAATTTVDIPAAAQSAAKSYTVYNHPVYGKFIDAREFGTDTTGKVDNLPAIQKALAVAHEENAAVYLSGKLYISDQIVLDGSNSGVTGIFGDGMGKTVISFDKAQTGVFNSNTNQDDVRKFAGILIDGQNGKTVAELSVKYTNPDFYRKGQSYFGKVNGIMVNDSDNTLISKVEVSGANRAGVFFSSTEALAKDPNGKGKTYMARVIQGEIDEHYGQLPSGENNRIENSHLHHNRVAGALVAFQENFVAEGNTFAWNGHKADGGTGYGIATMAGSYNYGVRFAGNTTDHNYRKGLDVHDGNDIVIENNVSNGDRLYGIAVYNRQFSMDNVKIVNNTVVQDAKFRLSVDDDAGAKVNYHGYSGIQIQTNTMFRDLNSKNKGVYEISGNTVQGLDTYKNAIQTYGIEFRNHERKIDYTLDIKDNIIEGKSTQYLMAVINDTKNTATGKAGPGSGDINIIGNTARVEKVTSLPIYIEEKNAAEKARGSINIADNDITVSKASNGWVEGVYIRSNAGDVAITDNDIALHGKIDKGVLSVNAVGKQTAMGVEVSGNTIMTDQTVHAKNWLVAAKAELSAFDNSYNGKAVADVGIKPAAAALPVHELAAKLDLGAVSINKNLPSENESGVIAKTGSALERFTVEKGGSQTAAGGLFAPKEIGLSGILGTEEPQAGSVKNLEVSNYSVSKVDDNWQIDASIQII